MIYSRWQPDKGGYTYYESSERLGINDDLPVPAMPMGTSIGVASTEVGRPAPASLRRIGSGAQARGSLLAPERTGVSGLDFPISGPWLLIAVAAAAAGYFAGRRAA